MNNLKNIQEFSRTPENIQGHQVQARTQGRMQGMHPPHQTYKGVDMTLNFIESHHHKCFCPAHYLIAKDVKN